MVSIGLNSYALSKFGGFFKTTSMKAIKSYLVLNMPAPATFESSIFLSSTNMTQIMNPPSLIYSEYFKNILDLFC